MPSRGPYMGQESNPLITPSQSAKGAAERFCTIIEHPEILKMPRRNLAQFHCAKFRLFLNPPVLKRSIIFHSEITKVLFGLDNTGPRSRGGVHVQNKCRAYQLPRVLQIEKLPRGGPRGHSSGWVPPKRLSSPDVQRNNCRPAIEAATRHQNRCFEAVRPQEGSS